MRWGDFRRSDNVDDRTAGGGMPRGGLPGGGVKLGGGGAEMGAMVGVVKTGAAEGPEVSTDETTGIDGVTKTDSIGASARASVPCSTFGVCVIGASGGGTSG